MKIEMRFNTKSEKGVVVTGTHVLNAVAVMALVTLLFELWTSWQSGRTPDITILLCLLTSIALGGGHLITGIARKR